VGLLFPYGFVPVTHALVTRWHWRAFVTGGGSAFWLLAYGLFYWVSRLSLDSFSSVVLYLGYLFLLVILDFLVTGQLSRLVFLFH
jgi:transmembrane 9 superfamily protein 2/4